MSLKPFAARRSPRAAAFAAGLATLAAAVAVPGLAEAGHKVTSGNQTLQITETLTPARAHAGSVLKLHADYESLLPNQHVGDTKDIQLQLPEDSHINPHAYAQCDFNLLAGKPVSQDSTICPKDSVLGGGTFTADARPTLAQPVAGTFTLYNVKGHHNDVLLAGKTKYGYISFLFLYDDRDLDNDGDRDPTLTATEPEGGSKGLYTIKTVDMTLGRADHKAFITNPPRCTRGGWYVGLLIDNYGSEPTIQANDTIHCRK